MTMIEQLERRVSRYRWGMVVLTVCLCAMVSIAARPQIDDYVPMIMLVLFIVGFFGVTRELNCWYWKINKRVELSYDILESINELVESTNELVELSRRAP